MLQIVVVDELCVPKVVCDHCFHVIESAMDGNYQWRIGHITQRQQIFFAHKACNHAFEAERGGDWLYAPLELLPFYLGNSLGVRWPDATRQARLLADTFGG